MPRKITEATSLDHLRKEAKRWLKAAEPALRHVQHALAIEYGHANWIALKDALEKLRTESASPLRTLTAGEYERLANDLVQAFDSHDEAALQRVNERYRRSFTFDDSWAEIWRRVYAFRQRSSRVPKNFLQLAEARTLLAQDAGFGSWSALTRAIAMACRA